MKMFGDSAFEFLKDLKPEFSLSNAISCLLPFDNPEVAGVVMIENGGHGNYAAEVARDVLIQYFGMNESFATTKLDVIYHGVSTHAAESPQFGKNALLSAANCIINLHSIPRNSDGQTRVNVGTVHAGTGRNVVPDTAKLEIEVRGVTTEVNRYMEIYARDIIVGGGNIHCITQQIPFTDKGGKI